MEHQRSRPTRKFWYEELIWGVILVVLAAAIIWKG